MRSALLFAALVLAGCGNHDCRLPCSLGSEGVYRDGQCRCEATPGFVYPDLSASIDFSTAD